MKIKNRLSIYFTLISSGVLLIVLVTIYITFSIFFKADFYSRLQDRANVAAQLYLEADEISSDSLSQVHERYLVRLPNEVIRLYDSRNAAAFIRDNEQYWTNDVIDKVRKSGHMQFAEGDRQVVGIYYKDNQGNFVILASAIDTDAIKHLHLTLEIMLVMFVLVSIGFFFAGRWFAQRALAPINKVVGQVQKIRASNLNMRVDEGNGKDEISNLARNFNRLLEHLENAFELQRTFVANASHELRTPVTSIIGEVEVSLNKTRTVESYQDTLRSVLDDATRLKETISSLMELAQVDMDFTRATFVPIRIDELLWELEEYWAAQSGSLKLVVKILRMPEKQKQLDVLANKSLLMIALNNIIGNAFKYSNGQMVTCSLYADEKLIRLEITDKGVGIAPELYPKLFAPFYRGDNAPNVSGHGIGLYITHKILQLFEGRISVRPGKTKGTTFTIEF